MVSLSEAPQFQRLLIVGGILMTISAFYWLVPKRWKKIILWTLLILFVVLLVFGIIINEMEE